MGLGRSFLDMLPRWFWCTIKLYITGIRLSPRMGSRTQVYDMVRCPCPPWWHFLPHLPWTSAPTQGEKLTWIFLRVCFAQYLFLPFFPYPITIDMIFFISYKVTGIILARVSNANVNKQLHSFYLQLLLLTIKNESANCPGFTVPSLLLTCQKGANMSGRATRKGAFKGQAHAQPVIGWTGGVQAPWEALPSKGQSSPWAVFQRNNQWEGWTKAWLSNYHGLPLEGDVFKQSLSHQAPYCPGSVFQPKFSNLFHE